MPTNWPPANAPAWPPPGWPDLRAWHPDVLRETLAQGSSDGAKPAVAARAPTGPERNQWFTDARCDDNHTVTGFVLVVDGVRYPFAVCDGLQREFLVLWPPFTQGAAG